MSHTPHFSPDRPVIVIGAGPAGLTAAYELTQREVPVLVCEQDAAMGGLARTVMHEGFRFDIGGHRFFTKVRMVSGLWRSVLGSDFLKRPRLSRIYYRQRFFDYPLKPANALRNLGLGTSVLVLLSYLWAQIRPIRPEVSFADWVSNRFGRRLYRIFFETYTEKVWGIPPASIGAEWAAQRIKGLSLRTAVLHMLLPARNRRGRAVKTLIDEFEYPRFGPGMMWERLADLVTEAGGVIRPRTAVVGLHHGDGVISSVEVETDGTRLELPAGHVISTMPVRELVHAFVPPAPPDVRAAADRLKYRDFLTVALIVDEPHLFPDNWIYIHDEAVKVGRIQNFKNWSPEMVPDQSKTCLGLEYFCFEGDGLWSMTDPQLVALATREIATLGLSDAAAVSDGTVVRMRKAYPVYDEGFAEALGTVRAWVEGLTNLQLIGRNGMHKYNNQDHSMLTAILAVRNLYGEQHDLWAVNAEEDYHEEMYEGSEYDEAVENEIRQLGSTQPVVPRRVTADPADAPAAPPAAQVQAAPAFARPSFREAATVLAAYLLATLAATWPLAGSLTRHLAGDLGDPLFNAWVLAWDAEALRTFRNVWNAPIFFPYENTLAYSEHLIGIGWPLAPVLWLSGSPIVLYNVAFLLSFVLAGGGMYLLVRALTGRADAALVAGCAYAFCTYRWIQISHIQVLMWGWLPVSVWAVHEYFRTRSRTALAVAVLAFALLGLSNAYYMFFGLVPIVMVGVYEWWVRRAPPGRTIADAALAAAVLAAVFGPVARAYAAVGLMQSWAHSPRAIDDFSASFVSYLSVMPHIRFWDWLPYSPGGETALFPGLVVLGLGLAALVPGAALREQRRLAGLYLAIALTGVILSFGPRPDFWPADSRFTWPYGWLVATVPGFSAMRVPARAAVIVFFALAVLAGFGALRVLGPRSARVRWTIAAIASALVVLDGYGGPLLLSRFRARAPQIERAAYEWIQEGPAGGILELPPHGGLMKEGYSDLYYQHQSLLHGRPLVNGSSRFEPPLTRFFKAPPSPLRQATQLPDVPRMLRSLGVRHVTIRPDFYTLPEFAETTAQVFRSSPEVDEHRQFGTGVGRMEVFRLREPWQPLADLSQTSWRPVPPGAYQIDASEQQERVADALDEDLDTRWITAGAQDGTEHVDILLDRPRDVARLRMLLGRSHGDYPRGVQIIASGPEAEPRILYSGSVLPQLAAGILADPYRTPLDLDLPPNSTRQLRIRQTGVTRSWRWSIYEIALWER